ncbi:MAG: MerR family transcriptional regulator [Myxococcales bacterium]|nr:MerR family transcriptional regulator [Myxococcales bacterium]
MSEVPDKLFFRIGEVAELVGVEPHVLRYWETEFKLRPQRSSSGQRLYRRQEVGRFLKVRQLLHQEGYTIAGARKAMAEATSGEAPARPRPQVGVEMEALRDTLRRVRRLRAQIVALSGEVRG